MALVPALLLPHADIEASLTRPVIVGRTMGTYAGGVSILAAIGVRFDRPVDGVDESSFVLRDASGNVVPAIVTYNASRHRAELLPRDLLVAKHRYEVTLSAEIRSRDGVAIEPDRWSFRTLGQPADGIRYLPARPVRFAPGHVTGIRIDKRGSVTATLTGALADHSWATADARVTIRGRTYLRIVDGKWAGYFVPAAAIVALGEVEGGGGEPEPAATASSGASSSAPTASPDPGSSSDPAPSASTAPPTPAPTSEPQPVVQQPTVGVGIVISPAEVRALPTTGAAWTALMRAADAPAGGPNLADMNQDNNVKVLAKALVYARTGTVSYRTEVISALKSVMGTESGGETLALGRELAAYVIAADMIGLQSADPSLDRAFRGWLTQVLDRRLGDGSSLTETHERRPNNWGTHAGASRAAAAAYLGDGAELARVATVFRGWLGERSAYAGFSFGELWWQSNPSQPVGINPPGARIDGRNVDGVLPDDQRRTGDFTWPPPCGNYPHGALDGAVLTAEILNRKGYAAYSWGSQALRRAEVWLQSTGCPPAGDNVWQLPLLDARYGTSFWNGAAVPTGKNFAWTDWLYGR